jgi:hypothetical protein
MAESIERQYEPTINNVLPNRKSDVWLPSDYYQKLGAIVAIWGGFNCPWCDSEMETLGENLIATCKKNPKHIVYWTPWGS